MHHDDHETLNLLEKYKKNKFNEKVSGTFRTRVKNHNNGVRNFLLAGGIVFIVYILATNAPHKIQEKKVTKVEATHEINTPKINPIENKLNNSQKVVEATPSKPKVVITQNIPKVETQKETTTIIITPTKKQEPIKKIEEVEEIKPSSSSGNIGYFR